MASFRKDYFSTKVKDIVQPDISNIRSRYDNKIRLRYKDSTLVVRNLKKPDLVAEQTKSDIIHTVLPIERHKPEIIAHKYYGDARLYWVILAANGFRDRHDIEDGKIIVIPSKQALYGTKGLLLK